LFRADEGVPLRVDWWPYLLRDDGFASERKAYEKARQRAVSEAKAGPVSNEAASEVLAAFDKLNTRFDSRYPRQTRVKTVDLFQHHLAAKRFLQSLGGEILRLQTAGTLASSEELRFTGNNLVALLTHMSRNGLVFAAAQPGDEAAYHNVFRMMRDLYITVADDDDSGTGR
jgi:hypothetical protein